VIVDVLFQTGSVLHHLPQSTAVLLANNLRAWPIREGSRAAADKIELFLVEETAEPIEFEDLDERRGVREAVDVLMAGPRDSPALQRLFECLGEEPPRST
jgi:hypothetical protein